MTGIVKAPGRQPETNKGNSGLEAVAFGSALVALVSGCIAAFMAVGAAMWIIPAYMLTFGLSLMGVPIALGFFGHCGLAMLLFLAKLIFSGGGK